MWLAVLIVFAVVPSASAQEASGSLRGTVLDKDFEAPLAAAQVLIVETGAKQTTSDQGNYVFSELPAGIYTVVISKPGYVRQVRSGVVVTAGQLTDLNASLAGEFTDMAEFVVQDILASGAGTEALLLDVRFDSSKILDGVSADFISKAGASDAADAVKLVSGATVQDGKFAVVRGLPDRYVSSQLNGVRLPSADDDTRAVELDQFPSPVLDSIQISKTFSPDQQGDASGGAVDVRLKGIPDETVLEMKLDVSGNSQAFGNDEFLSYSGGGVSSFGNDSGSRVQQLGNLGGNWDGAVGVKTLDAPIDFKWSGSAGRKWERDDGVEFGAFLSVFYERDSSHYDNGEDNSLWLENPGEKLKPQQIQQSTDPKTALFDITESSKSVQWGTLATLGAKTEHHSLGLTYLYTRSTQDKATLAEDTRGKKYFFPGYDPGDPTGPGNDPDSVLLYPYLRTETLEYTERSTQTLQLHGDSQLGDDDYGDGGWFDFGAPVFDWTLSTSRATQDQPDKRQFGSLWIAESFDAGLPPFGIPPSISPAQHQSFKPSANFNQGNLQRIFKEIEEDSDQYAVSLEFPFEQWGGEAGSMKVGVFDDQVDRKFRQDSFTNPGDGSSVFFGGFSDFWSASFPFEDHAIEDPLIDVDYDGEQSIEAWYYMLDLPLSEQLTLIGGARYESTDISIVNTAEEFAVYYPPDGTGQTTLSPGAADVDFQQDDILPSIGLIYEPTDEVTVRLGYSETVARQTFKELSPILQQEFLGGPVFIGNPELGMSALDNYDVRVDYRPVEGSLVSFSWFRKDIDDPIENIQVVETFNYTTPVNYPEGRLEGYEVEVRQDLGRFDEDLSGLSVGANATFIDSEVKLPQNEIDAFATLGVNITERDATNAPEYLYNIYTTYDIEHLATQLALFYTVRGDALVAGGAEATGNFVPSIYAKEFGTLNFSATHQLNERTKLQFKAKNLTNPEIEEVYRSSVTSGDATKTTYTAGREFSLSLSMRF
ncbi:MAG: TonB-dependent receptor [Planctomycetota bacterium]|nr:MAG: TonB-dependent receptor [Planctomycetota bacterium]